MKVRCKKCGYEFEVADRTDLRSIICPKCNGGAVNYLKKIFGIKD